MKHKSFFTMIVAGLLFIACNENTNKTNKGIDDPIRSPELHANDTINRTDTIMHNQNDSAHRMYSPTE